MKEELEHISTNELVVSPSAEEKEGLGGGGTRYAKTSHSAAATTSCIPPLKRRRGAQPGNTQAFKTGRYNAEARALNAAITQWTRQNKVLLRYVTAQLDLAEQQKRNNEQGKH